MKYGKAIAAIIINCLINNSSQAQTVNHLENVVSHLVGVMDTSAQAQVNPERVNVQMTTCELESKGDVDVVYLYQEQALVEKINQPYRQRILHLIPLENGQVESKSYKLINEKQWIGFCDRPESSRILDKSDLGDAVCSVFVRPVITIYIGETPPEGCPANVRGAVKITNKIILHKLGMDTFDRGFDAEGNQVWGAVNDSYQYRWLNK